MVIDTSALVAMLSDEPEAEQLEADVAHVAYRTYGKGRHRAALNYGDCISYALAKVSGQPLLFKGDDFGHTDVGAVNALRG